MNYLQLANIQIIDMYLLCYIVNMLLAILKLYTYRFYLLITMLYQEITLKNDLMMLSYKHISKRYVYAMDWLYGCVQNKICQIKPTI